MELLGQSLTTVIIKNHHRTNQNQNLKVRRKKASRSYTLRIKIIKPLGGQCSSLNNEIKLITIDEFNKFNNLYKMVLFI